MGDKIKCQICGEPATVHLTQIFEDKIYKIDLCEACATELGVTDGGGFSFKELVKKGLIPDQGESELSDTTEEQACPHCGFELGQFRKTGRLGCPKCYDAFEAKLSSVLKEMHRDVVHTGKIPQGASTTIDAVKKIKALKAGLAQAVKDENFEEAARLRDQIRASEESPPSGEHD